MSNFEAGALIALCALLLSVGGIAVRNAIWHTRNEGSAKAAKAIAEEAKLAAVEAHRLAASARTAIKKINYLPRACFSTSVESISLLPAPTPRCASETQ